MTFNRHKIFILFLIFLAANGCARKLIEDGPATPAGVVAGLANGATLPVRTGPNVVAMTVNGSTCAANTYVNKPCVSVTVCTPGFTDAAHCDTIKDILVDTGSFGLRVFGSLLVHSVPAPVLVGGHPLGNCAHFGDGSAFWGKVGQADVQLGGETALNIPIQVVDSTFADYAHNNTCESTGNGSPVVNPADAGMNGILGVGLLTYDCGDYCDPGIGNHSDSGSYFDCPNATTGTDCTGTTIANASQVINPVAAPLVLSSDGVTVTGDNNGLILELPSIPLGGVSSIETGYLILGIDTQTNNVSTGVNAYPTDANVTFTTNFKSFATSGFIDSGSNAYYFPSAHAGLPTCSGWYCPSATTLESATNIGDGGSPSGVVDFYIGNLSGINANANVIIELGGAAAGIFDWGLPFYIGRNVYHGIEGRPSSGLGTGPYWGF